jgi:GLPGLI family protein
MKKTILFLISLTLVTTLIAQVKEGKVVYERKVNMHARLTAEQASMKNMIPEFTTMKMELVFAGNQSIYKGIQEGEDIRESAGQDDGNRVVMRFRGGDDETYKNYSTGMTIQQRELGPKKYIIEDTLRKFAWKLDETGETKEIKGYNCKKATTKNAQGSEVVAWYSDQIVCPSGPEVYGGLPGLILELNINNSETVFTPLELTDKSDTKLVKAPTNGKKITRQEFQKMMDEQFGANPGGGPVIRIMRN